MNTKTLDKVFRALGVRPLFGYEVPSARGRPARRELIAVSKPESDRQRERLPNAGSEAEAEKTGNVERDGETCGRKEATPEGLALA